METFDFEDDTGADGELAILAFENDDLPNFDPDSSGNDVVGDPGSAVDDWHQQERPDSCAVVSQEFVLEAVTGHEFTEGELVSEARQYGWYEPGGGTSLTDVGNLLDAYGVPSTRRIGVTIADLELAVAAGDPVIVALDADEIWATGRRLSDDSPVGDGVAIPGQDANHAVTVIGFEVSESRPRVILNDPGHPEGRAAMVPADEFVDAWDDSGRFMVTTNTPPWAQW